mgnify:CR=1 FL=1
MKIQDLLRKDVMLLDLQATEKTAAIEEMIHSLVEHGYVTDFETFKEEFRKYYKDSFSKDLYKIIYSLYYNNLSKEELKDVYLGISDVFNEGNILETKGKELTEEYRKNLKNKIVNK